MNGNDRRRSRAGRILLAVLLLGGAGAVVWFGARRVRDRMRPVPAAPARPVAVEVWTVQAGPFEKTRRYPGTVEAVRRVRLAARITGRVTAVHVREGDEVARGDVVVALEAAELEDDVRRLEAARRRTQAELAYWKTELRRDERLLASRTIAPSKRDQTRRMVETLTAALDETEQALAAARTRLGYARIRAPFAGRVQTVWTERGDLAVPGKALVEIVAPAPLKVVAEVPQADVPRLRPGLAVRVHVPAAGSTWTGRVDRVYPALDPASRSGRFEVRLPERARVLPGMAVEAEVVLARRPRAVVVPHQALIRRPEGVGVYVVQGGVARWRPVEAGEVEAGRAEILAGLEPGDVLILTPDPRLRDGTRVVAAPAPEGDR